jgi:hypothetical protein
MKKQMTNRKKRTKDTQEEVLKFLGVMKTDDKKVKEISDTVRKKLNPAFEYLIKCMGTMYNLQELDFLEKEMISIFGNAKKLVQDRKKLVLGMEDIEEPINFHWSHGCVEVRWRSSVDGKQRTRPIPKLLRIAFSPPEEGETFTGKLKKESKESHPIIDDKKLR